MTKDQMGAIIEAVKMSHYNPEIGLRLFFKRNPNVQPVPEMYGLAVSVGRTPFPNIKGLPEGPFPVDQSRPWWDARRYETPEQQAWEDQIREVYPHWEPHPQRGKRESA